MITEDLLTLIKDFAWEIQSKKYPLNAMQSQVFYIW